MFNVGDKVVTTETCPSLTSNQPFFTSGDVGIVLEVDVRDEDCYVDFNQPENKKTYQDGNWFVGWEVLKAFTPEVV